MTADNRKPTGVRITTAETNGEIKFFVYPTAKKNEEKQNSRHTIIQPKAVNIVKGLDPTRIGEAVLKGLGLDK